MGADLLSLHYHSKTVKTAIVKNLRSLSSDDNTIQMKGLALQRVLEGARTGALIVWGGGGEGAGAPISDVPLLLIISFTQTLLNTEKSLRHC